MDTSKRSHEAPMTFNVVNCYGVLMPKVQEPIMMLRLTTKVSSQLTLFSTGTVALMAVSCRDNAGPTNLQMYSKVALETRKFSFHQPSSDLSFSNLSNQSCGRGRLHTLRRARTLVPQRWICLVKTAVLCCIIASNRHLWNLLRIKYRIKR